MDGQNMEVGGGCCKCPHHSMKAIWMIALGALFLLGAFDVVGSRVVEVGWPIIVLAAGLSRLTKGMCKCCSGGSCAGGKCC
ncbi:MAG: hypothetical protein AAB389_05010 [Patescibacteria group bacterium]